MMMTSAIFCAIGVALWVAVVIVVLNPPNGSKWKSYNVTVPASPSLPQTHWLHLFYVVCTRRNISMFSMIAEDMGVSNEEFVSLHIVYVPYVFTGTLAFSSLTVFFICSTAIPCQPNMCLLQVLITQRQRLRRHF